MVVLYKKTFICWFYIPVDMYTGWYAATLVIKDKMPVEDHNKYVLNSVYGLWRLYYTLYFKIIKRKFGETPTINN